MEDPKGFSEIWAEAHRERSEYVWSIISRLMATPRRPAPRKAEAEPDAISHPTPVTVTNR